MAEVADVLGRAAEFVEHAALSGFALGICHARLAQPGALLLVRRAAALHAVANQWRAAVHAASREFLARALHAGPRVAHVLAGDIRAILVRLARRAGRSSAGGGRGVRAIGLLQID